MVQAYIYLQICPFWGVAAAFFTHRGFSDGPKKEGCRVDVKLSRIMVSGVSVRDLSNWLFGNLKIDPADRKKTSGI